MTNQEIFISASSLYDELEDADDLRLVRGDLVHEFVSHGELHFRVGNLKLGVEDEPILGYTQFLMEAIRRAIFQEMASVGGYPEHDMRVTVAPLNHCELELTLTEVGLERNSEKVNTIELAKVIGRFHRDILVQTFERHPELVFNYSFLKMCPDAYEIAKEIANPKTFVSKRIWTHEINDV